MHGQLAVAPGVGRVRLVVLSPVAGSVLATVLGLGVSSLYRWRQHVAQVRTAVAEP